MRFGHGAVHPSTARVDCLVPPSVHSHTRSKGGDARACRKECSELPAQEVRQSPLAGPNNEHGAVPEPLVQQSTGRQRAGQQAKLKRSCEGVNHPSRG